MDCWYPITIDKTHQKRVHDFKYYDKSSHSFKYIHNDKGVLMQYRQGKMPVPCNRCPACRRRKQNEWAFRIMEEAKVSRSTFFVTLTYDDDNLVYSDTNIPTLDKERVHKLTKDLRYRIGSYRYFLCGEYGDDFDRPHYHICLFVNSDETLEDLDRIFSQVWKDGFHQIKAGIPAARAKYCAKYALKQIGFDYQGAVPPFARMSRRPGIGKSFLDPGTMERFHRLNLWTVHDYQGTPYPLPRYYREQIFSHDERELHNLEQERVRFYQEDANVSNLGFTDYHEFSAYTREMIVNRERLFIKHLQKENYGFKWKPTNRPDKRYRSDGSDLISDEF